MSSDWLKLTLGELCAQQGGAIQTGPFGSQLHTSDYKAEGTPVVMPTNIVGSRVAEDGIARIDKADVERLSTHKLRIGDLVFSRRGDVTKNALVRAREVGWVCGTGCLKVRLGSESLASAEFVSYYLQLPDIKEWLVQHAVGATMPNLNTGILSEVPLTLAPPEIQKKIVHLLAALDASILTLQQQNIALEAFAHTLFRSWFVDFDPVHAKLAGNVPEAMSPELAALFPSEFVDSELGLIPKGWLATALSEHTEVERGLSYKGEGLDKTRVGIPMHNLNSVLEFGGYKYAGIKYYTSAYKDRHVIHAGDIIVANTEQGHEHRLIGFPAIIPAKYPKAIFSHHLYRVHIKKISGLTKHFIYYMLMTPLVRQQIVGCTNGSTVNMLKPVGLEIPKFVCPTSEVVTAFENKVAPMWALIEQNRVLVDTLVSLRDHLLPRLISGKLRLEDAEASVAAITSELEAEPA